MIERNNCFEQRTLSTLNYEYNLTQIRAEYRASAKALMHCLLTKVRYFTLVDNQMLHGKAATHGLWVIQIHG